MYGRKVANRLKIGTPLTNSFPGVPISLSFCLVVRSFAEQSYCGSIVVWLPNVQRNIAPPAPWAKRLCLLEMVRLNGSLLLLANLCGSSAPTVTSLYAATLPLISFDRIADLNQLHGVLPSLLKFLYMVYLAFIHISLLAIASLKVPTLPDFMLAESHGAHK